MRLEGAVVVIGAAAALYAAVGPLASFLGLTTHTLRVQLAVPAAIPMDATFNAATLACVFAAAGIWGRVRWGRRILLVLAAVAAGVLTWFDPGLPLRLLAALPAALSESAAWLRAFWYGTARPPSPGAAFLLYTAAAWGYARVLWRVTTRRMGWWPAYAVGSPGPLTLWIYGEPAAAHGSLLALSAAVLLMAPALSAPAAPRRSGGWLRLAAGVTGAAVVLSTATALPALGARPVPVLNQGIQRLIPLTARGPGAGFGGPGAGSPDSPLVLGGPFSPVERGLLTVEVTIETDAPAPTNLYLRGIARPVYTGSALETAAPYTLEPGLPLQRLPEALPAARVEQWIRHEDFRTRLLYGAHRVQAVGLPGGGPVFSDADGSLYGPGPLRSGDRYRVVSEVPRLDAEGLHRLLEPSPAGYPEVDALYLQLPESLPDRVRDLALQVTADAVSPYQAARNIETFLRRFPYHEDTPFTPPGRDFVDYFLFDLQTGYCTYYTSAMVVMLRAAGIPARAVEGFILPLQGSGRYEVTGAQAHTWVEAYMPHYGWLTFEPTPAYPASPAAPPAGSLSPESAGDPPAPDLLDPRAPLPGLDPGLMPGLDDLAPVVPGGSPSGDPLPGALTAFLLVTGTLGAAAAAVAFRQRAVWRRSSPADRIGRHYLRTRRLLEAALAHAGASAGPNREAPTPPAVAALTPAELAAWGGRVWPALAGSLEALTGLYHDAAYGPPARRPDDAAAGKAGEAVRAVANGLRAQIGWAGYLKAVLTALLPPALPRPLAGQPR